MRTPRPYQSECVDTVFAKLEESVSKQLVQMATGLGKTYTGALIIKRMDQYFDQQCRTLWLTHREELIEQSGISVMQEYLDPDHLHEIHASDEEVLDIMRMKGMFLPSHFRELQKKMGVIKADLFQWDKPFVVASVQTIFRRLSRIPSDYFDLIVVDEAHMAGANTWQQTLDYFTPQLRLGLTATPYRMDGVSMSDLFDETVFKRDIVFGITEGYLCQVDAYRIKTEVDLDEVHTMAGEFNQKELTTAVNTKSRNQQIVREYRNRAEGRKALIFCVNVQHAMDLHDEFAAAGYSGTFVVADPVLCPDRKQRFQAFRNNELQYLTNVDIATTGFDDPSVNCLIMARPTKSRTLYEQCLGRGLRLKPDGSLFSNCLILDIVDNTSRHSLINTHSLDQERPLEERLFLNPELRQKIADAQAQKQQRMMTVVETTQKVDLLKLPKAVVYDVWRNREPATEKMLASIAKLGYDIVNVNYTKGQISEIFSSMECSVAQRNQLKLWGYDATGATYGQYVKAEQAIRQKEELKNRKVFHFKGLK